MGKNYTNRVCLARPPKQIVKLASVPLDADLADEGPKWSQIAKAGRYEGYQNGAMPFELTAADFQQIVENFHSHPSFQLGPDGRGSDGVVQWDYNHASEQFVGHGDLAVNGSPAQGWVLDVEMRQGPDGPELWALSEFYEPARSYVKQKKYKWASVALEFEAVDPISGRNVGTILTSVALTNHPFIEGMLPLVASKGKQALGERHFYEAETPMEAIAYLKELFGLPELVTIPELVSEINRFAGMVSDPPEGIDVENILRQMRRIMDMESLDPVDAVIAKAIAVAMQQQGAAPPAMQAQRGGNNMEFLAKIAAILGVNESEKSVVEALEDAVTLRKEIRAKLQCSRDSNRALLEATEQVLTSAERIGQLVEVLGVANADETIAAITTLMTDSAKVKELMPELEELRAKQKEIEEEQITVDVATAMRQHKLPTITETALTVLRRSQPQVFKEKYPIAEETQQQSRNVTTDVATAGGQPIPVRFAQVAAPPVSAAPSTPAVRNIDLSAYSGRNEFERTISYLEAQDQNFVKLSWDDKCKRAHAFRRAGR